MTKNDKIVKSLKILVERYKKECDDILKSPNYKEDSKIQTVSVLTNVIQDIELLLDIK
jgi:hypothetical protein